MNRFFRFLPLLLLLSLSANVIAEEISPYKFTSELPSYEIPNSSIFNVRRDLLDSPEITYYLSQPDRKSYPIAILCGGSSDSNSIASIIHFHRYFLQECIDLGLGVLTVEQWGVEGDEINMEEWISHYTRTQRTTDHQAVINHLYTNPPNGWNGKFVFIGVSEGGPIVTSLSEQNNDNTLATINWSGAGELSWRDELWLFLQQLIEQNIDCPHGLKVSDCNPCFEQIGIRENYDQLLNSISENPDPNQYFLNMTYLYHSDALNYPTVDYSKLTKPYLVVTGTLDTIISSSDRFVLMAKNASVPITYHRIPDMDHYVRKRPDVLENSFGWLRLHLAESSNKTL